MYSKHHTVSYYWEIEWCKYCVFGHRSFQCNIMYSKHHTESHIWDLVSMMSSATGDVISRHNVHFVVALIAVGCQISPIRNGRNTEKIWSPSGPNIFPSLSPKRQHVVPKLNNSFITNKAPHKMNWMSVKWSLNSELPLLVICLRAVSWTACNEKRRHIDTESQKAGSSWTSLHI